MKRHPRLCRVCGQARTLLTERRFGWCATCRAWDERPAPEALVWQEMMRDALLAAETLGPNPPFVTRPPRR